jgi:hypothetical protein
MTVNPLANIYMHESLIRYIVIYTCSKLNDCRRSSILDFIATWISVHPTWGHHFR